MPRNGILLRQFVLNAVFHALLYFFAQQYRLFDTLISEGLDLNKILFFCLLAGSFCVIQYALIKRAVPIGDIGKSKTILIVAAFLAAWLMLTYPLIVHMPRSGTALYVQPLNEKNPQSKGAEVWIDAIYVDGKKVSIRDVVPASAEWEIRDKAICCTKGTGLLRVQTVVDREIKIVFIKHPWSGKVKVRFGDGTTEILDLFSEKTDSISIVSVGSVASESPGKWLVYLFLFLVVYVYTLTMLLLLDGIKVPANPYGKLRLKTVLMYMIPSLIVWCVAWYAFYPAVMISDSLDQWDQMLSIFNRDYVPLHQFNNWHPAMHTLLMGVLTLIWDSPGIVVIVQILCLSLVLACFLARLEQLGIKRSVLLLLLLLYSFSPVNATYVVNIWKDTLYSIALFSLTFVLFEVYVSDGAALKSKSRVVLLILSLLGTLFRHNGIIALVAAFAALFLAYRKKSGKTLYIVAGVVIAVLLGVRVITFNVLHASHISSNVRYSVIVQHIASVLVNSEGHMRSEDRELMNKIMPEYLWKKYYNPYYSGKYMFSKEIRSVLGCPLSDKIREYKEHIFPIFFHVLYDNPRIVVNSWLDSISIVWRFEEAPGAYTSTSSFGIEKAKPYDRHLSLSDSDNPLRPILTKATIVTRKGIMKTILWRHGLYLFLLLVCLFLLFRNGGIKGLIITIPCAANIASLLITTVSQNLRYVYPSLLIVPLLLIVSLILPNTSGSDRNPRKGQSK